jgi:hypothetical protein
MDVYNWQPKNLNLSNLLTVLRAANLPISFAGWAEDGSVHYHWQTYPTDDQRQRAAQIIFDHNPAPTTEETKRIQAEAMGFSAEERLKSAETSIKDISTKTGGRTNV